MNKNIKAYNKINISAKNYKIAIITSKFNFHITNKLLEGAEKCLKTHGVLDKNKKVLFCPGAFELPLVATLLAKQKKWDAIICLGAVIKGDTPHFDYVCTETARGIQDTALKFSIPVVFGVLTTNNQKQAIERIGGKHGHKGWDAALTALEMIYLRKKEKI